MISDLPRWANNTINDDMGNMNTKGLELSCQALRQCSQCELPTACLTPNYIFNIN